MVNPFWDSHRYLTSPQKNPDDGHTLGDYLVVGGDGSISISQTSPGESAFTLGDFSLWVMFSNKVWICQQSPTPWPVGAQNIGPRRTLHLFFTLGDDSDL